MYPNKTLSHSTRDNILTDNAVVSAPPTALVAFIMIYVNVK